ncbi:Transcriptional repressor NrdR [Tsukamurella paurometabola]|uniref:Transcriptional repressor NrdR n=2 Tax=Tsukamurella paurometabola TaxID=2061 RepID=A0A3P8K8V8_TSUPA|nr:Transcriptional repressor NrdR [Tsukamurella paurometabola]
MTTRMAIVDSRQGGRSAHLDNVVPFPRRVFSKGRSRGASVAGATVLQLPRRTSERSRAGGGPMYCPFCKNEDTRVVDSRVFDDGQGIRRRRSCNECGRRFTTVESAVMAVVKRNGVTEPFSREKVVKGVRRACQGRDVAEDDLHKLAQQVEEAIRATGVAEVPANEVGLAILGPLRDLDEVAYLRFASVYQGFSSIEDFEAAIRDLRARAAAADPTDAA